MKKIIFSFFLFFFGALCLSGQFDNALERLNQGKYKYGDRVGKMHLLEDVFKSDSIASVHFSKFNKARKRQRNANLAATGLFAATIGTGIAAFNGEGGGLGAAIILVNGSALAGLVAIIGNASSGVSKGKHKERLIEYVNKTAIRIGDKVYVTNVFPQSLKYLKNSDAWELNNKEYSQLSVLINDLTMDDISQSLYMDYSHSHMMKKRAKKYAYVFGGLTAAGTIINRTAVDPDTRKDSGHIALTQILPLVVTLISVGGLNKRSKEEKRARKQFLNYINGLPTDITFDETPYLEIIGTANGLGIAYRF